MEEEGGATDLWLTKVKRQRQVSALAGRPGLLVDLGCGYGQYHRLIPARRIIGLDIRRKSLRKAKEEGSRALLVLGSVDRLPFRQAPAKQCCSRRSLSMWTASRRSCGK